MALLERRLDDGVLTLRINRPERHNAWTPALEEEYFGALLAAAADPDVRAILVTGAGTRSFCPGLDAEVLAAAASGGEIWPRDRRSHLLPTRIPKPIVCAINGGCAGLGLVIALMCDVRFAAETARFATSFTRRGLPGEQAISWVLPRLIGLSAATDLLMSGRTFDAAEAYELGLIKRPLAPADLHDAAESYARDLARNASPTAMATIKLQMHRDLTASATQSWRQANGWVRTLRTLSDLREGAASLREQRPPQFRPLEARVLPTDDLGLLVHEGSE